MITVAQLGCGYWGPNLLRNLTALRECRVKYVADASADRRAFVQQHYPAVQVTDSACDVLADAQVDAVVIATPASTHAPLAMEAIAAGKHVFVEKPLAMSVADAELLGGAAGAQGVVLMAGHTFLYNAAVTYLRDLVASGALGDIYYVYAQRLNLGVVRNDVDALWNLAPHDVSIINHVLGQAPETVLATGTDYLQPGIADVVFMQLQYPGRVRASVQVSWLDPNKVRRMTIVGSRKMVVYDDIADDKIAIYDKGIDTYVPEMAFDTPVVSLTYRTGDVVLPRINFIEPIKVQMQHFLRCVATGAEPVSGAGNGRDVVAVLEAATASMRANGRLTPVAASAAPAPVGVAR